MIRRTTWVVLGLFVVLLVGAWYFRRTKENSPAEATFTPVPSVFSGIEEKTVSSLRITDAQGDEIALDRDVAGLWTLIKPQAEATDASKVESSVSQLVLLTVLSKPDPAPALDAAGLTDPSYIINMTISGGQTKEVKVGKVTPTQSGYYIQVDGGEIVVVSKLNLDSLLDMVDNPPILETPTSSPGGVETQLPEETATAEPTATSTRRATATLKPSPTIAPTGESTATP